MEIANPNDSYGKLLIFNATKNNSAKINVANLIASVGKMNGDRITFTKAPNLPLREPYDTTAWISGKRALKFEGIIPSGENLDSSGYGDSRIR
jgi:hypothetical protein